MNLCSQDYYFDYRKDYQSQQCKTLDKRNPASVGKLKPIRKKRSIDSLARFNKLQRRVYRYLKRGSFQGADLDGNGKIDIKITKTKNGSKQIAYSFRGDGKMNQISVYNPQGILIRERVDQDMDGQVDYLYECKKEGAICETSRHFQNGKPSSFTRKIASDTHHTYELYERKNGKLELVQKKKEKIKVKHFSEGKIEFNSEGEFCFDCYNREAAKFTKLLNDIEQIQKGYEGQDRPGDKLPKLDDFRVSKTGILIHEECFDKGRFQFDPEKAIVDGLVTGFSKLVELEKQEIEEFTGEPTAIIKSHVPRFVQLFSRESWEERDVIYEHSIDYRDGKIYRSKLTDPCVDLQSKAGAFGVDISKACEYIKKVAYGRPKIFCDLGEIEKKERELRRRGYEGAKAFAQTPQNPYTVVKKRNGKTKIYGFPSITFVPESTKEWSSTRFQSTLFHEFFHNLGYEDEASDHNSYGYMCQVAAFYEKTHMDVMNSDLAESATIGCISSDYNINSPDIAGKISFRIGDDKD